MTKHDGHDHSSDTETRVPRRSRVGRRRFLGGVGASGLAAVGVIFGRPNAANATVRVQCCNLCKSPTISLATCKADSTHYLWYCTVSGHLYCACCETSPSGCPSGVKSAASCYHS